MDEPEWVLENFEIHRQKYDWQGIKAGTYVCTIKFENGQFDTFTIGLSTSDTKEVFFVLKETILQRAAGIGSHLEKALFPEDSDANK